jgi:hypothetical protein
MPDEVAAADPSAFSRPRNPDRDCRELRVADCPDHVLMWLDAESHARAMDRGPLVIGILEEWAKVQAHQHMMRERFVRRNPDVTETRVG